MIVRHVFASLLIAATAFAGAPSAIGAPAAAHQGRQCGQLSEDLPWHGDNRAALQQLLDKQCGAHGPRPVAVFDWDNTVIKNDAGDATFYWLLRHDGVMQPPADDWRRTSRYLTKNGAASLKQACGTDTRVGRPLPTATDPVCADEILSVYSDGVTTSGAAAFAGYDHRTMEPSYAWVTQLLAGRTPGQVRSIARAARAQNLAAPHGATQLVGTHKVTGWVRYYDQSRDLIRALNRSGYDVWITSASPQQVVEVWADGLGIDAHHVIGIRGTLSKGRLDYHLQGCGDVRDGQDSVITYIDGKRCWINKVIYKVRGSAAWQQQVARLRPSFAAGDSNTDVTFLQDATDLRLVLNRNKAELMCRAYDNADGRWLINPMFIDPKGQQSSPYPCSTTAYEDAAGVNGPVIGDDGRIIADQADTAFG